MRANQAGWVVFVGTIAVLDGACSGRLIVDRGPGSGGAGATASGGATSGAAGSAASAGSGAVASSGGSSGSGAGGAQGGSGGSFGSGGVGGVGGPGGLPTTGAGGSELPPLPPPVCGGVQCKESEDCCLLTVKCFDKSDRSACPVPSPDAGVAIVCGGVASPYCNSAFTFCASNTDCGPDGYCSSTPWSWGCAGPGFCQPRTSCYDDGTPSCACDGKTYANNCESSLLGGVRTQLLQSVPCGTTVRIGTGSDSGTGTLSVTPCGFDSQCGSGEKCCAISGLCYDASRPVLCTEPPAGTSRPCETQADCIRGEFCDGPGCTGPGGCRPMGSVKCDPLLKAVCGCDGRNYGNASCAKNAGSRVASEGACPL